jgi:hypothetical protein
MSVRFTAGSPLRCRSRGPQTISPSGPAARPAERQWQGPDAAGPGRRSPIQLQANGQSMPGPSLHHPGRGAPREILGCLGCRYERKRRAAVWNKGRRRAAALLRRCRRSAPGACRHVQEAMVGAGRFELPTPSPPDWCANQAALRSVSGRLLPRRGRGVNRGVLCARNGTKVGKGVDFSRLRAPTLGGAQNRRWRRDRSRPTAASIRRFRAFADETGALGFSVPAQGNCAAPPARTGRAMQAA